MILYHELPSTLTDVKSYLTVTNGKQSIIQNSPMWIAGSFSRTEFVRPLYTNASLEKRLILVTYKL
jgi:hypothetical protein